jgi:type II secretory pathway pseudopilin PulG
MPVLRVPSQSARASQSGFGYLLLLFALILFGIVLAGLGRTWAQARQRERETELLSIGKQFSQALASYRDHTPSGQPKAPQSLEDLLEDKRFPFPVRHLRRLYKDPMTHEADWETTVLGGRIVSVHSHSRIKPLREKLPDYVVLQVDDAQQPSYAEWIFTAPPEHAAADTTPPKK